MTEFEGNEDHYAVLGVEPTASTDEIRRAFRRNTIVYHRKSVLRIGDRLERMTRALEVLADPERRRAYDAGLRDQRRAVQSFSGTAEHFRREGKLRYEYAQHRARDARRASRAATRGNAAVMRQLLDEHDWLEIEQAKAQRRREVVALVAKLLLWSLVIGLAAYWWMDRGVFPRLW